MTVALAGVVSAVLVVGLAALTLAAAVVAQRRADAAADLAALAAATRVEDGADAREGCRQAARVAQANGGKLVECHRGPALDVTVRVRVVVGRLRAVGQAHAGVVPTMVSRR